MRLSAEQYVPVDALRQSERFSSWVTKRDTQVAAFEQKRTEQEVAYAAQLKGYEERVTNFAHADWWRRAGRSARSPSSARTASSRGPMR